MEKDIVPALWEKIESTFTASCSADPLIKSLVEKNAKGNATQGDLFTYAKRLGVHASKSLTIHINLEDLPDGRLYWNIAERTVGRMLEIVHSKVNDYGIEVLSSENESRGIRIKGVSADYPEERVRAMISKLTTLESGGGGDDDI